MWNVPQTIALTRIPRGPNSAAAALVSALRPAFAAAYTTVYGTAFNAAFELMLMIEPPGVMCSAASAVSRSGPLRLTAIVLSNSSDVTSSSDGGTGAMPALLTSTSMRPNSAIVASMSAAHWSQSPT